jgi:hypothetical protein
MRAEAVPAEPWRSFLQELDGLLKGPVELRCLGGFVVTQQYGIGRETSDIDFLTGVAQSPMMMSKRLPAWDRNCTASIVSTCSMSESLLRRPTMRAD